MYLYFDDVKLGKLYTPGTGIILFVISTMVYQYVKFAIFVNHMGALFAHMPSIDIIFKEI